VGTCPSCLKEILIKRHLILKTLRQWFYDRGFIEIQTPVSSDTPIPEASIDLFEIKDEQPRTYLLPSPELYLKPLLCQGLKKFFSIGPAFRKKEKGRLHLPQFTMLEWYRAHADYTKLMEDCQGLILSAWKVVSQSNDPSLRYDNHIIDLSPPFEAITIHDAFTRYAGWDPISVRDEERFDKDLVFKIEPSLPRHRPVFLLDFPAWAASLSRLQEKNCQVSERVELFIGGIELANGFSELMDPEEQEKRFHYENKKRRHLGLTTLTIPSAFLSSLKGCPPSAGMALGVDRLVMLLTNSTHIRQVSL